ncbi:hypothetical protein ACQ4LE_001689 [Meloidogyne hapla]
MSSLNEMDVDQILGTNNDENIIAPKKGEKKNANLMTALECTKSECQQVRETMINVHEKIKEEMKEMKQQIVSEVLHAICPVLEEIKSSIIDLGPKIANLENNSDSEPPESDEEEIPPQNLVEEQQNNARPNRGEVRENRGPNLRENRGENARANRGGNHGRPRGRARDSRLFYILRQIQREQDRNPIRGRWPPYEDNHRNYRARDGNPRFNGRH